MYTETSYMIYLAISIAVTIWVAKTLHQRGRIFLVDAFGGNVELADSVNHLLVVGFYLINVGFVALALRTSSDPQTLRGSIELVADKTGTVLLVLGAMHFFNLFVFSRIRRRAQDSMLPPIPPDALLAPER